MLTSLESVNYPQINNQEFIDQVQMVLKLLLTNHPKFYRFYIHKYSIVSNK